MKQQSKLTTHQQEEQTAEMRAAKTAGQEIASVEELLRHDAGQTVVPPQIAERLGKSLNEPEPPRRSWWRRLLD